MTSKGHIVPHEDSIYSLGHKNLKWDGWFNDLVVSGQLHANDVNYNHINECLYDCKTLHLATSGFCHPDDMGFHNDTLCGYLSDESIDGGGFEIHLVNTIKEIISSYLDIPTLALNLAL